MPDSSPADHLLHPSWWTGGPPIVGEHVVYTLCALLPGEDPEEALEYAYVGVTSNLSQRLRAHARKRWWPRVAPHLSEFQLYPDRETADRVEAETIALLRPTQNLAGVRR